MQKQLLTQIDIHAPIEKVWQVLMDSSRYAEWNPLIDSMEGELREGARLQLQIQGMRFKPVVLVHRPPQEFCWKGQLLSETLFTGSHRFRLQDHGNGTVTFFHSEDFSGWLVGLFSRQLDTKTKNGFEAMNRALKERCEHMG